MSDFRAGNLSYQFDSERAERVRKFIERLCHFTTGRWARRPFTLTDWQRDDIVEPLFGWTRYDTQLHEWVRRYRLAWIELGRGCGKTTLLAACGLYLVVADGEESAEVYGCAADREQASHVFRAAARMVDLSPVLSKRLRVIQSRKTIIDPKTDSFYRVIARDAAGNLGQNPHGILFDEVISQPNRELWDALKSGMGKRSQPLMIAATTAGNDPASFAAAEHEFSRRVAENPDLDPARFVYMRNTPAESDWRDERNWHYANPALKDGFLSLQTLRDEAREAEANPASENAFRQYRLCQWVAQTTRWLPLHLWDLSAGLVVEDQLVGRRCYGGLDLASSSDIAALCWDFPDPNVAGAHDVLWRFFVPEARLPDLDRRTGGRASTWVRQGYLTATEGDVIDYDAVLNQIDADARRFDVVEVGYDRWGATQLSTQLTNAGLTVVPIGQGFSSLSPPTKEFERLVRQKAYRHGGNPVMRWMIDGVVVRTDPAGNVKPDKGKSADRIDGVVAGIMALDRALRGRGRSIYEQRGLEVM